MRGGWTSNRSQNVRYVVSLYAWLSLAVRCRVLWGRDQPQRPHDFGHLRCVLGFVHAPSASFPHFFEHLSRFHGFFRSFFAHFLILRPHARFCSHAGAGEALAWHREYPESHDPCGVVVVGDRHR